jgi:hypothetical protein
METDNSEQTQVIGRTIKRLLEAGEKDAAAWVKQGDEINRYRSSDDYGFLYQEFDSELSFKARVNKASEFTQILGPYLYQNNPDATVTPQDHADEWSRKRMVVEEKYADYAARHGGLAKEMRRTIDHALVYGRSPLWCGWNSRKGIVSHISDTVHNLVVDPDAKTVEEQNWQARKRIKPRWELAQRYPASKHIIDRLPVYAKPSKDKKAQQSDPASELVCYHEIWMGVGVANYAPSLAQVKADLAPDLKAKKKYCIADGQILHESDWEIPFFLIDEWPGTYLDLLENPGCMYPVQPMEPGIGHLRAMNYLYTLFMAKYRLMSRTPFARITHNGQAIPLEDMHKIISGSQIDILNVVVNGGDEAPDINKLFQRIDWGDPVPGFERAWGLAEREFEKSTGLAEILYSGETSTQIRTAAAAQLLENNSKTRIDQFREVVGDFMSKVYRKTLFAARYLHDPAEIGKLFGNEAGALWGELGPPQMVEQESALRAQLTQQAEMQGMPGEEAEKMLGPPQFVSMESWITEADRTVDGGSMRRIDHDAQLNNLNVALNQLAPAVVNMPGGAKFVSSVAKEFAKINRFSPELQEAAEQMGREIDAQAAMMAAPPMPGAPLPVPPNGGPAGGAPMTEMPA